MVIDVANQANVYVTESGYRDRVLGALVSAVTADSNGWWLEVKLLKSALSPELPLDGAIGLDFNFRDNDADNDPSLSTVYTWSDFERSGNFPSKIPERWGRARLLELGTAGPPSVAENPMPVTGALDVGLEPRLAWEGGLGASSYRVHFGVDNPPPFVSTTLPTSFDPGRLEPDTSYRWRIDAVTAAGTTLGPTWSFTTGVEVLTPTLRVHRAAAIVIDGNPSDWNLSEYVVLARAGTVVEGDIALVGYDGGTLYWAGRATGVALPVSLADHTARVYARHDDTFLYFLVWLSDDDIQAPFDAAMNWANDSLEIYLDPSADGGTARLESSTSDVQLVIAARNQTNVYVATPAYRAQVLAGVRAAVLSHASGWWCELRINMNALDPDLAGSGSFGLDFNFRDNDGGNDPARTTVYTWSDTEQSGHFPKQDPEPLGTRSLRDALAGLKTRLAQNGSAEELFLDVSDGVVKGLVGISGVEVELSFRFRGVEVPEAPSHLDAHAIHGGCFVQLAVERVDGHPRDRVHRLGQLHFGALHFADALEALEKHLEAPVRATEKISLPREAFFHRAAKCFGDVTNIDEVHAAGRDDGNVPG